MRLGLSSDVALGATAAELLDACVRRGLGSLELRLSAGVRSAQDAHAALHAAPGDIVLAGLLADPLLDTRELAAAAQHASAPIVIDDAAELSTRIAQARAIRDLGGRAVLLVRGACDDWLPAVDAAGLGFVWQVDAQCADPAAAAERILREGRGLEYVRLVGGGPEAALQEGQGVGALMQRLALAGYTGALILAPSSQRYRLAWSSWLGRRGGWGCGSKADQSTPLRLAPQAATGGHA